MRLFPTASAVLAAERRLEESKQRLRDQCRVLSSPAGIFLMAGIGTLSGIFVTRHRKLIAASARGATSSLRVFLISLLLRFIAQRLTNTTPTNG